MEEEKDPYLLEQEAAMRRRQRSMRLWIIIGAAALIGLIVAFVLMMSSKNSELEAARNESEQQRLDLEMLQSAHELDSINAVYAQLENQAILLANDSLIQKYDAARQQIEKLMNELKNEKQKSRAEVDRLKNEIATLKGILRDYTQRIDELMAENEGLRTENEEVKNRNRQLDAQVQQVQQSNRHLSERMTLAEKLNVTGVDLRALNRKGKNEKNITKATQLMVTFTIPQNNSTPPGEKTIYLRIVSPEGDVLGSAGTFPFEGAQVKFTARKSIEYAGEEIGGVTIYWDVNATLNPGDYTVELFTDGYRLCSRSFAMKK